MSNGQVVFGSSPSPVSYANPNWYGSPTAGQTPASVSGLDGTTLSPAALQSLQAESDPSTIESAPPVHHESSGGGLLDDVGNFFSGAAHTVENTVSSGANSVGNFFSQTIPKAASSVATLPLQLLAGHYNIPAPGLPPYPPLNPAEKQRAMRPGQTVSQPSIEDSSGNHHEPVTLIYNGPLNNLETALKSQGWSPPGLLPMSKETLHGQPPVLSLQKNAQLGGLSRDHLRVYKMGNKEYGIACTRDLHPAANISAKGISFGHATDNNLNGERDLVMNDILKADPAAANTWRVVQGVPQESLKGYTYDRQVYEFSLG